MTTLIDEDYLKQHFDIADDIKDDRLQARIGAASRRLRKWVGDSSYQSASSDPDRLEDFQLAEGNLAMHFAILGLNAPITSKGVVKSAKAEDNAVLSYMSPGETTQLKEMFLQEAEDIMRPYLTAASGADLTIIEYGGCQS